MKKLFIIVDAPPRLQSVKIFINNNKRSAKDIHLHCKLSPNNKHIQSTANRYEYQIAHS